MKRMLAIILACTLTLAPCALAAAETPAAPTALFAEGCNPFAQVDWPEGYAPYWAVFQTGGDNLYNLYVTVEDTAANAAAFFAGLVGETNADYLADQIQLLADEGMAYFDGTETGEGFDAIAFLYPSDADSGEYDAFDGYAAELSMVVDGETLNHCEAFAADNYSANAAAGIAPKLSDGNLMETSIGVNRLRNCVVVARSYRLTKEDESAETLLSDDCWSYSDPENGYASYDYGDLFVEMTLCSGEDYQGVTLLESRDDTQTALSAYAPSATLRNLGFTLYDANCGYQTDDVWLGIYRTDWGAGEDTVKCAFRLFGINCFVEIRYPSQIYTVQFDDGNGGGFHYDYDAFADTYTPEGSFPDWASFRAAFDALTGQTADMAVGEPVMFVDDFCYETFGYKPEHLIELPRE